MYFLLLPPRSSQTRDGSPFIYRSSNLLHSSHSFSTNGNYALGSPQFCEQASAALGRRTTRGKAESPRAEQDA